MKGTFNIVTRALERAPYWQKVIRESGWELSCAGARWLDFMHVKPEEEDKQLREAIQSVVEIRGG
jgi:peptidoglycan/xylan/chitin deacetylase (PgdA/CDA1 family)